MKKPLFNLSLLCLLSVSLLCCKLTTKEFTNEFPICQQDNTTAINEHISESLEAKYPAANIPTNLNLCDMISELKITPTHTPDTDIINAIESVWVTDISQQKDTNHKIKLELSTENFEWYFADNILVNIELLNTVSEKIESQIYPVLSDNFGDYWRNKTIPEQRLKIIHVPLGKGIAGYFNDRDMYPKALFPHSNELVGIYVNTMIQMSNPVYLEVLTHELQHAIHWNQDRTEETWVNEGLSEYGVELASLRTFNLAKFNPETSLVNWPYVNQLPNYITSNLFMKYFYEHYVKNSEQKLIFIQEPLDGIHGINNYLMDTNQNKTFYEIFSDWGIANLINESNTLYGYSTISGNVFDFANQNSIGYNEAVERQITQFSTHYIDIAIPKESGELDIYFEGTEFTQSFPYSINTIDNSCWWSNKGDSINTSLTGKINLDGLNASTLSFSASYDIEENWDFAYIQISNDNQKTWQSIKTKNMKTSLYALNHLKHGYTGRQEFINYSLDLSEYQNQDIHIKFSYITDGSTTGPGFCVGDIKTENSSELKIEWMPDGFVYINNNAPQGYMVNIIQMGLENKVIPLELNHSNRATIRLPIPTYGNWYVISVVAYNEISNLPATYTTGVNNDHSIDK